MPRHAGLMYNEDLKHRFISDTAMERNLSLSCFRATAPCEEELGRDLCTMTADELKPALQAACGNKVRKESRDRMFRAAMAYYKWCLDHEIDGAVRMPDIDRQELIDVSDNFIIRSPAHLQKCLDEVFDPESEETVDNVYRCYLWMLYGGLDNEHALMLKAENILFDRLRAEIDGEAAVIYPEAIPCVKNCVYLKQFQYKHPLYTNPVWRDRTPGEYILRGVRATYNTNSRCLREDVARRIKKKGGSDVRLSTKSVWFSGLYYRIFQHELAYGMQPEMTQFAALTPAGKKAIATNADKKSSLRQVMYEIASGLKEDYERWKKAIQNL